MKPLKITLSSLCSVALVWFFPSPDGRHWVGAAMIAHFGVAMAFNP